MITFLSACLMSTGNMLAIRFNHLDEEDKTILEVIATVNANSSNMVVDSSIAVDTETDADANPRPEDSSLDTSLKAALIMDTGNGSSKSGETMSFPSHCRWDCYLKNHPELAKVVKTEEAALDHYLRHGAREGQDCSCDSKTSIKSGSQIDIPFAGIPSRFWTCQRDSADTEQEKRKIIFVHVFKTAGTTFRQFFRNYAHICNRRTVTIRCTMVLSESLTNQTSEWMLPATNSSDHTGYRAVGYSAGPCAAGDFVDGKTDESARKSITSSEEIERYNNKKHTRLFENLSYSELQKHDVDILSGHMPMGLHSNWYTKKEKEVVTPLYITFFRDPVDRFVSGQLQVNKQMVNKGKEKEWDFEAALAYIVKVIKKRKTSCDGLSGYLMTPAQKVGQNITLAEKKNIMKSNLVDFPVIIGVVERMADSLNLMRYAMNSDGNALVDKMFETLNYQPSQKKTNGSKRRLLEKNKSKISTSALVREIQKDTDLFATLKSNLRDEYEIYDYAMELHKEQVKRLSKIRA